jgi:hypothetical protein
VGSWPRWFHRFLPRYSAYNCFGWYIISYVFLAM